MQKGGDPRVSTISLLSYGSWSTANAAESPNVTGLPDAVASAPASDAEYRMYKVVEVRDTNMPNSSEIIVTLTNSRELLGLCVVLGGWR